MKFSSYTLSALHAQLLISSFGIYESYAFHTLSPTAHNNRGSAGRTNVHEVDLGRRIGSRQFPCFASAVEGEIESVVDEFLGEEDDDIDSVLDSMLGEIYTSDENGKGGAEKGEHIPGSSRMPSSLVEKVR